jgi:dGTPase
LKKFKKIKGFFRFLAYIIYRKTQRSVPKMDNIRKLTEQNEHLILSPLASFSDSAVRERKEERCDIRTDYQRDRDRIIHSGAFRRLKHKTQVFLSPEGDHYRTRLTHTLEVAQISRTVARALRLNEDLTEAIALGHDLGHTPFGHAGERALDKLYSGGFKHYLQSVRVCTKLEKQGKGLNLTLETLNGIACHTKGADAHTLEGRIVRWCDQIAYINHDIDDAVRGGVIKPTDIPKNIRAQFGETKSERINNMVLSLIENSKDNIIMANDDHLCFDELHNFLYDRVYLNYSAKAEEAL